MLLLSLNSVQMREGAWDIQRSSCSLHNMRLTTTTSMFGAQDSSFLCAYHSLLDNVAAVGYSDVDLAGFPQGIQEVVGARRDGLAGEYG